MTPPGSFMPAPLETPAGLARSTFQAMGTTVTVLLPKGARDEALAVETLFETWEETLSRFRTSSELSRLNAANGRQVLVGRLLFDVVRAALDAAAATGGLFDPTLLNRLIELGYDRSFEQLPRPRISGRDRARGAVIEHRDPPGSWREVRLDERLRSITLPASVGLDLGGIAKGMAVDAAITLLAAAGAPLAAVEAGGDLAVHGEAPGDGWQIAVETGEQVTIVAIDRGAVATSSVSRRRWIIDGEARHHLIDPRTGRSTASDATSVTVAAGTCREAEVAAKCALILGVEAGARFLECLGFAGLISTTRGERIAVGRWRGSTPPDNTVGTAA